MKGNGTKSVFLCITILLFTFSLFAVQTVSSSTQPKPVGGFVLPAGTFSGYIFMLVIVAIAVGAAAAALARKRLFP